MKKILSLVIAVVVSISVNAQTPQGINYQGVARNAAGVELVNQAIGIEISVVDASPSGTILYTETHSLTTDNFGLFTLVIGNGTPTLNTFAGINWATGGSKWLKVSMDATGATSYQLMGTSQMMSVPYALHAGNVTNNGGKQTIVLSDDVTNTEAANIIANEVGPNTQEIKIVGTSALTNVDLSMITTAIYIEVTNNDVLANLNLSGLTRCDGPFVVQDCPLLSSLAISNLAKITTGEFTIDNTALSALSLPNFVKCNGNVTIRDNESLVSFSLSNLVKAQSIEILNNNVLTSYTFGSLTTLNSLTINNNDVLTAITFPGLQNVNYLSIGANGPAATATFSNLLTAGMVQSSNSLGLTTLDFPVLTSASISLISPSALVNFNVPALATIGSFNINNSGLVNFSLPSLSSLSAYLFSAGGNKFSVATINGLLAKLVSISPSLTGKQIDLQGQSPMAAPSGQGITDKNTLITNGNSVNTD